MGIFELSTPVLTVGVFVVILGSTAVGHLIGRNVRSRSDGSREPFAVIQAAMLGFMALVLAFGLSLAVGRYESRRAAVVDEANAIGTTYLRAQTLDEPQRTQSLDLLRGYTDASIQVAQTVPGSPEQTAAIASSSATQRSLWSQAGTAVTSAPTATAPRLYVEGLNEAFDSLSTRISGLGNRVPTPVLLLELVGAPSRSASSPSTSRRSAAGCRSRFWPRRWSPQPCSSPSTSTVRYAGSSTSPPTP